MHALTLSSNQPAIRRSTGGVARQFHDTLVWQCQLPLLREYEGNMRWQVADPRFVDPGGGDFRLPARSPARTLFDGRDAFSSMLSSVGAEGLPDYVGAAENPADR